MSTLPQSALAGRFDCQETLTQLFARFTAGAQIVAINDDRDSVCVTVTSGEDSDSFTFERGTLPADALLQVRGMEG